MQLPLWAIYAIMKQKGDTWKERFYGAFQPTEKWGPTDPVTFEKYQKYISNWKSDIDNQPPKSIFGKFKEKVFA